MTRMRWIAVLLAAAVLAGCQTTATEDDASPPLHAGNPGSAGAGRSGAGAGESEPLSLDSAEAAALLGVDDDAPPAAASAEGEGASNFRCLVCHGDFAHEELSVTHARHDVGCERCHGPSDAHCADENNITPPDVMFPRDRIVKACMECHPADKLSHKEHHWDVFAPKDDKPRKVCTDCHGKHRVSSRDVRWDKKTGKLLKGGWMEQQKK